MICQCCSPKVIGIFILLCLGIFVVSLVLDFKILPDLIVTEVNKAVRLDENTDQYDRFIKLPVPIDFKVYIFEITNKEEVLNAQATPNLVENGPYVYKQFRSKKIIEMDEVEDTITFEQTETFEYNAVASGSRKNTDMVTIINPVLSSIYQIAERLNPVLAAWADQCLKYIFQDERFRSMIIEISVQEAFFDGVQFCQKVTEFPDEDVHCNIIQGFLCTLSSTKRNVKMLDNGTLQFAFFDYKQSHPDGQYTIKRGRHDISTLGHIVEWNSMKFTKYWVPGDNYCNEVKGTDSTLYPPHVKTDDSFYVYSTDICRYVQIDYISEGSYKGIDGLYFGTNERSLYPKENELEKESCYCTKQTKGIDGNDTCFLDGTIDMQSCTKVPVVFSFPHFLWADKYREYVTGLKPDVEQHRTFLLVEPNTGTPLEGSKKIQLNIVLRPIQNVKSTENYAKALVPVLWLDEGLSLDDDLINLLNDMYFNKIKLATIVIWVLPCLSAAFTVCLTAFFFYRKAVRARLIA